MLSLLNVLRFAGDPQYILERSDCTFNRHTYFTSVQVNICTLKGYTNTGIYYHMMDLFIFSSCFHFSRYMAFFHTFFRLLMLMQFLL